ncbi:hypothetical protein Goshw_027940 [Gossypium schwendimanii]|uniref:RNase H type-1 domain-containing protein n=1 Tax=Gossypium schwendimanii TaxID=34291 RepID=A0A7J9MVQ2_GOSSC|nr:hypothetical protein [Gossypium schwendimanii]
MPDKKDFSYSFPCDGPGQGGTCDISAWDAFYSLAGMAILAHSVLMVIPNYFMQSMVILKGLYEEIEQMVRFRFLGTYMGYLVVFQNLCHGGTSCSHVKLSRCRIVGKDNMSHLTGARQMTHEEAGFKAVRGIVRDQGGAWNFVFNKYLRNCSIFYNEAWGILERLSLIIEWSYDNVLIQFDCLETVITIQERSFERSNSALVRRIHQTLSWFKQWSIRHISREENSEADHLVKLVQHRTFDLRLFETSL